MMPDTHTLHTFIDWLIRASWQASVLAGLVLLIQQVFRSRLPARWRHGLWLLVVLRLILPALPASHLSIFRVVPPAPTREFFPPLVPQRSPIVITSASDPTPARTTRLIEPDAWDWRLTFIACWASIAGLLALRLLLTNLSFARRIAKAQAPPNPDALWLLDNCRRQMHVRHPVALLETDAVSSPAVLGVFRPRLLLPPGLTDYLTSRELRFVFLHEMAHIRRCDLAINWLLAIVRILHWFNPVIWLAVERCRADRELACDEMVLSSTNTVPQEEYGMTIIKLVQHVSGHSTTPGSIGIVESKAQLRHRIARIAAFDSKTMHWSLLGLVLVLVLSSVALTETKPPQQAPALPPTATAPASQAVSLPADQMLETIVYDISDIAKDPYYLVPHRSGPGGMRLEPDEGEIRQTIGRPGGFIPAPNPVPSERVYRQMMEHMAKISEPPEPVTATSKPSPEEAAELRLHAAKALVELIREKMLSHHADSPQASAYWHSGDAIQIWSPTNPEDRGNTLIIKAAPVDHEQIRSLLADLREDSKIKIAVDCRFVSITAQKDFQKIRPLLPKEAMESTTLESNGHNHRTGPKTSLLDDKQLDQVLKAVKADSRSTILTTPHVVLRNNQEARVEVKTLTSYIADLKKVTDSAGQVKFEPQMDQTPTGSWLQVSATASRDRKNVQMKMESKAMRLVSLQDVWLDEARAHIQKPVTWQCGFEGTLTVPSDCTQVLVGQELPTDPRDPEGPKERLILLITPRVIAGDDQQAHK